MISKIKELLQLPKVKIEIINNNNDESILKLYKDFIKPHPKYKIIKNKTIGVMLYELPKKVEEYDKKIAGKNGVGYFSRRCTKMGYYTKYFKQSNHLQELYNINTSTEMRQGRKMTEHYLTEVKAEEEKENVNWYGIYNSDNVLVGYIRLIITPKLYVINGILGHFDYLKDNIMHLLLHDLMIDLIEKNKEKNNIFIMYDTYFGATDGLKLYKKKHCFNPYRVKWKYIEQKGKEKCEKDYIMTT